MSDPVREKYLRLMTDIAGLEDRLEDLNRQLKSGCEENPDDTEILRQEIKSLSELLAEKRNELSRLSDGCGKPHPL